MVDPFKGRPIDQRPLWRLVNGERRAQAMVREVPGAGSELVITVDGELRWAQLYRGGIGLGMAAAASVKPCSTGDGWMRPPRNRNVAKGALTVTPSWCSFAGHER